MSEQDETPRLGGEPDPAEPTAPTHSDPSHPEPPIQPEEDSDAEHPSGDYDAPVDRVHEYDDPIGPGGWRAQWPLLSVVAGLALAMLVVSTDHFRRGAVLLGVVTSAAFFLRLLLSDADAGWLAVRSRKIDLIAMAMMALGVTVFALIVPNPN